MRPFIIESLTKVFLLILSRTNLPTSVFFAICSANCYLAITRAKPYLLANFFAIVVLFSFLPPTTKTPAGLFGLLFFILNLSSLAMSSRISSRDPFEQSISK